MTRACEWGDYTTGGLFVTVADYPDAKAFAAVQAQLKAAPDSTPLTGIGDAAIQQSDGVTIFKAGTTVIGVYSAGAKPSAIVALAKKVLNKL